MNVSRRNVWLGSAAGPPALAMPAIASSEPTRIGFLLALTGPSGPDGLCLHSNATHAPSQKAIA